MVWEGGEGEREGRRGRGYAAFARTAASLGFAPQLHPSATAAMILLLYLQKIKKICRTSKREGERVKEEGISRRRQKEEERYTLAQYRSAIGSPSRWLFPGICGYVDTCILSKIVSFSPPLSLSSSLSSLPLSSLSSLPLASFYIIKYKKTIDTDLPATISR